ncbi:MAG: hypothetical protein AB9836_02880 [Aminipila sp.]
MRNSLFDLHCNRRERLLNSDNSYCDVQGTEEEVESDTNNTRRCLYGNNVNGCFRYEDDD